MLFSERRMLLPFFCRDRESVMDRDSDPFSDKEIKST
jgi:hypothetical protein